MMRINLLPPEILERRKAEKRFGWVILAAVLVGVLLVGVYAYAHFRLQSKQDELAEVQQLVASTQAQADQLAIFEQRATELEARRATVDRALAGRRDWGKLYTELSLVLPSDVWIQSLVAGEGSGLSMSGYAIDAPGDTPDAGHKAVAKALVRLTDLDDLYDVWLSSSSKTTFASQPAIQFSVTAAVVTPGSEGETP